MTLKSGYPFWLVKNGLPFTFPKLDHDITTDVVIIGAGISGALARYYLVNEGIDCVTLDARTIGLGSTSASTSLLQYEIDRPLCKLIDTVGKEKAYLLDMAVMAIWKEGSVENADLEFVYRLAEWLGIDEEATADSIAAFDVFIKLHKKEIAYFKYSNPVKHFYDHTSQFVITLINRNKKRLVKELANNGELMVLLTHSTHRSLNQKEKKKVHKQLLEICKTVPSLTIFLLPGGSLLLPLLIKFIPQLLPSAFNENLENE